ncbi:hypothetical protein FACS1894164_03970 [Spirochaetia bacterium]|nr:hypothetical protein FACS1894164_03970 [Spirochaetia bacterium]
MTESIRKVRMALRHPDKSAVLTLLTEVNLTLLEKEIIIRSELDGESVQWIACTLVQWKRHRMPSFSYCEKVKRRAMRKIGLYLTEGDQQCVT